VRLDTRCELAEHADEAAEQEPLPFRFGKRRRTSVAHVFGVVGYD